MMLTIQICQRQVIVLLLSGKVCTYKKKHTVYRVQYCLQFQASAVDLRTCSSQIMGDYYTPENLRFGRDVRGHFV